jgi:SulP family sulfate permease
MAPHPADPRRRLADVDEHDLTECPQLKIVSVEGPLFFGAANHVSETIEAVDADAPRHLLLVGHAVNFIDVSGALVLTQEAQRREKMKKRLYLCRLNREVYGFLRQGDFLEEIKRDRIYTTEYDAIARVFNELDVEICMACKARIFEECQSVPQKEPAEGKAPSG